MRISRGDRQATVRARGGENIEHTTIGKLLVSGIVSLMIRSLPDRTSSYSVCELLIGQRPREVTAAWSSELLSLSLPLR